MSLRFYDLRAPCASCPFRTDRPFHLLRQRKREIAKDLTDGSGCFICHKTVHYGDPADDAGSGRESPPQAHHRACAGALIVLAREDRLARQNVGMGLQVALRLGWLDPGRLALDAPVYDSLGAWVQGH